MRARAAAQGQQGLALFNIAIKAVKIGLAQGIHNVFVLSMGLMIAGLIVVFFVNAPPVRNWGLLRSCPRWARPAQKVFFSPIEDELC